MSCSAHDILDLVKLFLPDILLADIYLRRNNALRLLVHSRHARIITDGLTLAIRLESLLRVLFIKLAHTGSLVFDLLGFIG